MQPQRSRIVTASGDRAARIWDAASGKEIAVLGGRVNFAAFSPDGSRIVTAGDGSARIWDVRLETMRAKGLLAGACARLAGATKLTRARLQAQGYRGG